MPTWFIGAIDNRPEHDDIDVDGCNIHVRTWGSRERPALVFVHGGAAHSGWWDHIAPLFSRTHRVIAPDLSGHGDSDARTTYHLHTWAREVLAAATSAGPSGRPTIVGHSMGGWVTATAAQHYGAQIDSIVVIDSPLRDHAPERARLRNYNRHPTGRRTKDEIVSRFVAVPAQETVLPYVERHIAAESVQKTRDGWFWKFDPAIFDAPLEDAIPADEETMERTLAEMPCRVGYLRCEAGLAPAWRGTDYPVHHATQRTLCGASRGRSPPDARPTTPTRGNFEGTSGDVVDHLTRSREFAYATTIVASVPPP